MVRGLFLTQKAVNQRCILQAQQYYISAQTELKKAVSRFIFENNNWCHYADILVCPRFKVPK